jgi:hypothetical protein
MLLAACATNSAGPDVTPRNPAPPPSKLPESPPNYLGDALLNIEAWRSLLQQRIQKPAS